MTKSGLEPLETIGLPLLKIGRKKYFNHYPLDKSLTKDALKAARSSSSKALAGAFATVSACTGTKKRADELFAKYGVICENMEGAAIAHICCMYDIPCIEIRGISNLVEDRDISKWDIQRAAANCQKAVIDFIGRLEHSSLLMRNRAEKGRDR